MRQIVISRYGGPDVLQARDQPDPQPGDHEIRIRVRASGVNFADILARIGLRGVFGLNLAHGKVKAKN